MRPMYGRPGDFPESLTTPTATFPEFLMGFCSDWTHKCAWKKLKSVAFPVPEIIGVPKKFGQSLDTPTLPFLQKFSSAFIRMDSLNVHAKFEICSFPRSWDNRGYPKKLSNPWIRPRSLFSEIFNGLSCGWTLWMYWPNLKSVAFPVPEIIGGTQKIWAIHGYAHASFSPKVFMGFYSDGPSEYTGQIWNL